MDQQKKKVGIHNKLAYDVNETGNPLTSATDKNITVFLSGKMAYFPDETHNLG